MELHTSLQKLHCRKHLTSPPLPLEKNSAVLGDLEKWSKNHWGGGRLLSPPRGGAPARNQVFTRPAHENDRSASTVVAGSVMIMRFY